MSNVKKYIYLYNFQSTAQDHLRTNHTFHWNTSRQSVQFSSVQFLDRWIWRGCLGVWHAQAVQVSVSWQSPEEAPVDPHESWSCSSPSLWSRAPSRRYGEISSGTRLRGRRSFSLRVSKQGPCFTAVEEDRDDKRLVQFETRHQITI